MFLQEQLKGIIIIVCVFSDSFSTCLSLYDFLRLSLEGYQMVSDTGDT